MIQIINKNDIRINRNKIDAILYPNRDIEDKANMSIIFPKITNKYRIDTRIFRFSDS